MAGAGPAADSSGNIYFLTGNGTFDTTLDANGFPNQGDFGNSFVKVSTSGGLSVADYFAMSNTVSESNADEDLGSGGSHGPAGCDRQWQPGTSPGGRCRQRFDYLRREPGFDGQVQFVKQPDLPGDSGAIGGVYSCRPTSTTPSITARWEITSRHFPFPMPSCPRRPASQTGNSFGYPGSTPGISANGTANAILWAVENSSPAVLHAYDATNLATEFYNSNQAAKSATTSAVGTSTSRRQS